MTACTSSTSRILFLSLLAAVSVTLGTFLVYSPDFSVISIGRRYHRINGHTIVQQDGLAGTNLTTWPINATNRANSAALNATLLIGTQKGQHHQEQGYLLVVDYEQQLMGGYMGFYHLANITSMLNLSSVEPYVRQTGLEGAPIIDSGGGSSSMGPKVVKLSDFYNLNQLKNLFSSCCSNNKLVSFENFVDRAARDVVMVSFLPELGGYKHYFEGSDKKIVEISNPTHQQRSSVHTLNQWQKFVTRWQGKETALFRVSRSVLIDARPLHLLPLNLIVTELGGIVRKQVKEYGSATIILDSWRDIQIKFISKFFYSIPGFEWRGCDAMDTVGLSESVINAADEFRASLKVSNRPVIAIHVRGERLLMDFNGSVSHYMNCLQQVKYLLSNGTLANVTHGNVHLFHDLGKYGSKSCTYSYCFRGHSHFLSVINKLGYKVVYFDPKDFRPAELRGAFAAFVELEYLSNVDVLITVGRGEYQDHIVERFIKNHPGLAPGTGGGGGQEDGGGDGGRGRVRGGGGELYRICHNPQPIPSCYPNC